METCRGRLTTPIPLHWAGGWAVSHAAGVCWCFAKTVMNPAHSRAFSWRDRGGQAIPTWVHSVVFSEQWHGVLKLVYSCLPPKRERGHEFKDIPVCSHQKSSVRILQNIISFLQTSCEHISLLFWMVNILAIDHALSEWNCQFDFYIINPTHFWL